MGYGITAIPPKRKQYADRGLLGGYDSSHQPWKYRTSTARYLTQPEKFMQRMVKPQKEAKGITMSM